MKLKQVYAVLLAHSAKLEAAHADGPELRALKTILRRHGENHKRLVRLMGALRAVVESPRSDRGCLIVDDRDIARARAALRPVRSDT